jgi:sigma-B regulation protein RsbU (phosphoserine phosphatase)
VEVVSKPLAAHDVVVRVGTALQRPDLLGRMDRERDQSEANLEVARRMQLGLLPTLEQIAALQEHCAGCLSAFYRPGDAVGGDFWGAWPTGEGRLALALVDFAGHGLSAA